MAARLAWRARSPARPLARSLRHGDGGVKDGCLTCNGPHFRERRDAGRQKHQQHLINHNLSQIRIRCGGEAAALFQGRTGGK